MNHLCQSDQYSALDYQIHLFSMVLIDPNSRIGNYINYVISRLSGKASEHTVHRRRNATTNPYLSIDDVLNQLSDLYETPSHIQYETNQHICENLKQGAEQPFPEFYTEFMRYVADDQSQERQLIRCLEGNITKRLREAHMMMSTGRDWTFAQHKDYLTRVDFYQRLSRDSKLQTRVVANTPLFLALIQKNIDVEKTLGRQQDREDCSAAKSRVTYQSGLRTLSPAENSQIRPGTVRTAYDLDPKTQIRDL
ncbi:MAG: hypothetical protein ASARMPREDX12_002432 [Alectoria sarmentosa]|nr:MAG: hypothetical protein ASARMPREDX12_002432 [Alectoria sarmentosa]